MQLIFRLMMWIKGACVLTIVLYASGLVGQVVPLNDLARNLLETKTQKAEYRFAVLGDPDPLTDFNTTTGMDNVYFNGMLKEMANYPKEISFLIICGDLVHRGTVDEYSYYYNKVQTFMETSGIPVFSVPGNHEFHNQAHANCGPEPACAYKNYYEFIDPGMDYYFDFYKDRFIIFNNVSKEVPDDFPADYDVTPTQQGLLQSWLSGTKGLKFTFMHVPFSRGSWMSGGLDGYDEFNNFVGPEPGYTEAHQLFVNHDVSIAFSGHIHAYFHEVRDGIDYIITGGGQPWLGNEYFYPRDSLRANHWLLVEFNTCHSFDVKMNVLGVSRNGEEIVDNFNVPTNTFSSDFDLAFEFVRTALSTDAFTLYPNPSVGLVNINLNHISTGTKIPVAVYNSLGQLIYEDSDLCNLSNGSLTLPESGIYFVKLKIADTWQSQKVVVQ